MTTISTRWDLEVDSANTLVDEHGFVERTWSNELKSYRVLDMQLARDRVVVRLAERVLRVGTVAVTALDSVLELWDWEVVTRPRRGKIVVRQSVGTGNGARGKRAGVERVLERRI